MTQRDYTIPYWAAYYGSRAKEIAKFVDPEMSQKDLKNVYSKVYHQIIRDCKEHKGGPLGYTALKNLSKRAEDISLLSCYLFEIERIFECTIGLHEFQESLEQYAEKLDFSVLSKSMHTIINILELRVPFIYDWEEQFKVFYNELVQDNEKYWPRWDAKFIRKTNEQKAA